jgi:hypothetical protein
VHKENNKLKKSEGFFLTIWLEVAIRWVGSGSGRSGRVSLIKKIIELRVWFRSTRFRSGRILDRTLSSFLGFQVILSRAWTSFRSLLIQVTLNFGSFKFRLGRVSGHLILDSLGF